MSDEAQNVPLAALDGDDDENGDIDILADAVLTSVGVVEAGLALRAAIESGNAQASAAAVAQWDALGIDASEFAVDIGPIKSES